MTVAPRISVDMLPLLAWFGAVVHLVAVGAHVADLALDAQVLGMRGIRLQRRLRFEIAHQHHVARVVDAAAVDADLQVQQARHAATQAQEAAFELFDVGQLLVAAGAAHVPHHDVADHARSGFSTKSYSTR
jgi:hypothetical protein